MAALCSCRTPKGKLGGAVPLVFALFFALLSFFLLFGLKKLGMAGNEGVFRPFLPLFAPFSHLFYLAFIVFSLFIRDNGSKGEKARIIFVPRG